MGLLGDASLDLFQVGWGALEGSGGWGEETDIIPTERRGRNGKEEMQGD